MTIETISIVTALVANIAATLFAFAKYGLALEHRLTKIETVLRMFLDQKFDEARDTWDRRINTGKIPREK